MNWSLNHSNWKCPGKLCTILFFFSFACWNELLFICVGEWMTLGGCWSGWQGSHVCAPCFWVQLAPYEGIQKLEGKQSFLRVNMSVHRCGCSCSGWQILLLSLVVFHSHSSLLFGLNCWEWMGSVGWKPRFESLCGFVHGAPSQLSLLEPWLLRTGITREPKFKHRSCT